MSTYKAGEIHVGFGLSYDWLKKTDNKFLEIMKDMSDMFAGANDAVTITVADPQSIDISFHGEHDLGDIEEILNRMASYLVWGNAFVSCIDDDYSKDVDFHFDTDYGTWEFVGESYKVMPKTCTVDVFLAMNQATMDIAKDFLAKIDANSVAIKHNNGLYYVEFLSKSWGDIPSPVPARKAFRDMQKALAEADRRMGTQRQKNLRCTAVLLWDDCKPTMDTWSVGQEIPFELKTTVRFGM